MKTLFTPQEVSQRILKGEKLILSGSESCLRQLPRGEWIAGTIPYFMSEDGGSKRTDLIQVLGMPKQVESVEIRVYKTNEMETIPTNYPENGFSFLILPGFSEAHYSFGKNCSNWRGIFDRPLIGWIAGIDLDSTTGAESPLVFDGRTLQALNNEAVVMNVHIDHNFYVQSEIINIFERGQGDQIVFAETGFDVTNCQVNGKTVNFYEYCKFTGLDLRLPLVADYLGTNINVSFKSLNAAEKSVTLYAPVFPGVEYRQAQPVKDYEQEFKNRTDKLGQTPYFTCNCILNYLYANLEGKKTGSLTGPMTFGEIAYMLLNQTLVHVSIDAKKKTLQP